MRSSLTLCLGFLAIAVSMAPASAKPLSYAVPEDTTAFRPGHGSETAQNNCTACHSVDYVATQPPKKGKEFWAAEVTKMIKVYGAPIPEQDAAAIADYLASTY